MVVVVNVVVIVLFVVGPVGGTGRKAFSIHM